MWERMLYWMSVRVMVGICEEKLVDWDLGRVRRGLIWEKES